MVGVGDNGLISFSESRFRTVSKIIFSIVMRRVFRLSLCAASIIVRTSSWWGSTARGDVNTLRFCALDIVNKRYEESNEVISLGMTVSK